MGCYKEYNLQHMHSTSVLLLIAQMPSLWFPDVRSSRVCLLSASLHTLLKSQLLFKGAIDRLCLRSFVGSRLNISHVNILETQRETSGGVKAGIKGLAQPYKFTDLGSKMGLQSTFIIWSVSLVERVNLSRSVPSPTDLLLLGKSFPQPGYMTYLPIAFHLISFWATLSRAHSGISCYWQDEKDAGEKMFLWFLSISKFKYTSKGNLLGNMLVLL